MNESRDLVPPAEAQLRSALHEHWGVVMSMTDTERELARFQGNVQRDSRRRVLLAAAASVVLLAGAVGAYLFLGEDRLTATPASGSPMTGSADLLLTQNT